MSTEALQSLIDDHHFNPSIVHHIIELGVETERIRLQTQQCLNGDSLDTYINVMEGERLLLVLHNTGLS